MSTIHEDQIPALVVPHLLESRKEKSGILYGFETPALEAGVVEGGDTVTLGKDGDAWPKDRQFVPMLVSDTEGKLILTPRDAVTLGFQAYSDEGIW